MTKDLVQKYNKVIDQIYDLMVASGYNWKELNKLFIIINLRGFTEIRDAFLYNFILLKKVNEELENYEICSFIDKYENEIIKIEK